MGMDSTSATTGCLLGHLDHHRSFAELTGAYWMDPPIYSGLVADWRAYGRAVPGQDVTESLPESASAET
ncbi:MAG: hypothetical protein QOF84_5305 [Streptomyces sp.]|jgi:hypothetical protein|nr:hypothetical protein [Streptomyces sp.]MDX6350515.1 hypothetical protein [Streptomyces sp.]